MTAALLWRDEEADVTTERPPYTCQSPATHGNTIPNGHLMDEVQRLTALIGKPPTGSHPDEWLPRAATWHEERLNWMAEVERLKRHAENNRQQNDVAAKVFAEMFRDKDDEIARLRAILREYMHGESDR